MIDTYMEWPTKISNWATAIEKGPSWHMRTAQAQSGPMLTACMNNWKLWNISICSICPYPYQIVKIRWIIWIFAVHIYPQIPLFSPLGSIISEHWVMLKLVLLNQDMPCLCKQCRSRSVGFWTDLDLHCLPFSIWICINNLDQVNWLPEN